MSKNKHFLFYSILGQSQTVLQKISKDFEKTLNLTSFGVNPIPIVFTSQYFDIVFGLGEAGVKLLPTLFLVREHQTLASWHRY